MEDTPIGKLLLKLSPPVMLALLIQSIYNIVDSYFVAKYSFSGLTALSIIFPIQLLITALSTGTGTGLNILVSRMSGSGEADSAQRDVVKSGLGLGAFNYLLFVSFGMLFLESYYAVSSDQLLVQVQGVQYARIIFLGSFGLFLEANCTKLLQAKGDMVTPMLAQVTGALINVVLDPILIFGWLGAPALGIVGAAIATVVGQWAAMGITLRAVWHTYDLGGRFRVKNCLQIYRDGLPAIVMQSLCTIYIVGLNLVLKQFTEDAVTVLGIYYKLQTFFFIPLMGLQQVIVPVISFNYGARNEKRTKDTLKYAAMISCGVMLFGSAVFLAAPQALLSIFSAEPEILRIGTVALRVIALSFVPSGLAMMFTVYFQGVNRGGSSILIIVLRQILLLVPLAWVFHFVGLSYVWLTFPVTEVIALLCSLILYQKNCRKPGWIQ